MSLRSLLLILSALGLLPIALLGAWGINSAIEQQRDEMERSMLSLSRALGSAVGAELDAAIIALRALSYNPALVRKDMAGFRAVAEETVRARPDWIALSLRDAEGRLVFSTDPAQADKAGQASDSASLVQVIKTWEPVVGHIAKDFTQRPAVPVRIPVMIGGELNFVLTAMVNPERILEIVQRQKVPDSWVISVHDASTLRVARSKDHEKTVATGITPSLAALLNEGRLEGTGIARTLEGAEVLTAYTRIPPHGWIVAIGFPAAHLKQAMIRSFAVYIAGIAASLAIYIVLAFAISRRIVAGIRELRGQAQRLGQGQPVQVTPSLIHELDQMAMALQAASENRMAVEQERENLMASLNQALKSLREALTAAEEAGKAKDNFLAVLSHELRNPLAPIVNALDLMDARSDTSNIRERRIMRRQAEHMKRLIDDLLDVSRITQGKLEMRKEPVNLIPVIQRAVEAVQPIAEARKHAIKVTAPAEIWATGDATRLIQMVTNLLSNALRFDPEGNVSVSVSSEGRQAKITVRDQGEGMTPETAAQVFKPFYQGPQAADRSTGGLGLGLAIVHGIVELHGGKISVTSAGHGTGTTFEVLLPAIEPPDRQIMRPQIYQGSQPAKVLVVDDNTDAGETIAEILKIAGHDVKMAHHGKDGLAIMADFAPDVVILDIGLPDMDGFEIARTIRSGAAEWKGKLIALTGYGQENDKIKAAEAGFDHHLTKPVDISELLRVIG